MKIKIGLFVVDIGMDIISVLFLGALFIGLLSGKFSCDIYLFNLTLPLKILSGIMTFVGLGNVVSTVVKWIRIWNT